MENNYVILSIKRYMLLIFWTLFVLALSFKNSELDPDRKI